MGQQIIKKTNLGRIIPVHQGEWKETSRYFPLDIVSYLGGSYMCSNEISAPVSPSIKNPNPVTNIADWKVLCTPTVIPIGTMLYFAGDTVPLGWLEANGKEVSKETYKNLYEVIKHKYRSYVIDIEKFSLPHAKELVIENNKKIFMYIKT